MPSRWMHTLLPALCMSLLQGEETPPLYEYIIEVQKPHLEKQMDSNLLPASNFSENIIEDTSSPTAIFPTLIESALPQPCVSLPSNEIRGAESTGLSIDDIDIEEQYLLDHEIDYYRKHKEYSIPLRFEDVIKKTTPSLQLKEDSSLTVQLDISEIPTEKKPLQKALNPSVDDVHAQLDLHDEKSIVEYEQRSSFTSIPSAISKKNSSYTFQSNAVPRQTYLAIDKFVEQSAQFEKKGIEKQLPHTPSPAVFSTTHTLQFSQSDVVPELKVSKHTFLSRGKVDTKRSFSPSSSDIKALHVLRDDYSIPGPPLASSESPTKQYNPASHPPVLSDVCPVLFTQADENVQTFNTQKPFIEKKDSTEFQSNSFLFSPNAPRVTVFEDKEAGFTKPKTLEPAVIAKPGKMLQVKETYKAPEVFDNKHVAVSHMDDQRVSVSKLPRSYTQSKSSFTATETPQEYYIPVDELEESTIPREEVCTHVASVSYGSPSKKALDHSSHFYIRNENIMPELSLPSQVEKAALISFHTPFFVSYEKLPGTRCEQDATIAISSAPQTQSLSPSQAQFIVAHTLDRKEIPEMFATSAEISSHGIYSRYAMPMANQIVALHYEQDMLSIPNERVLPTAYKDDLSNHTTTISKIKKTLAYANTVAEVVSTLFPESLSGEFIDKQLASHKSGDPHFEKGGAVTHTSSEKINRTSRLTTYNLTRLPTPQELNVDNYVNELDTTVRVLPRKDKEGYFFTVTLSPACKTTMTRQNQNIVFILDRTSSILAPRFEAYKKGVYRALNYLSEGDTFNILIADSKAHFFEKSPVVATRATKRRARQFLDTFAYESTSLHKLQTYDLLYELNTFFPKNEKHNTAIFITDGSSLLSLEKRKNSLEKILKKNQGNITLHTATAARGNNTPMLDILSTFHSGEFTYSPTLVAFPRKLARLVKKTNSLLVNSMHVTPVSDDPTLDLQIYQSNDRLPHIYNGLAFTIYGAVNKLDDFEVIFQGKVGDKFIHCPKTISFKNAKKGAPDLYKKFHIQKAYSCYEHYIEKKDPLYLKEAQRLLQKYRLPAATLKKNTFNK